jgi:hypothetical protein
MRVGALPVSAAHPWGRPDALLHCLPARFVHRPTVRGHAAQLYSIAGWTSVPWLWLRQPTLARARDDDPIVPLVNGPIPAWLIPTAASSDCRRAHLIVLEDPPPWLPR